MKAWRDRLGAKGVFATPQALDHLLSCAGKSEELGGAKAAADIMCGPNAAHQIKAALSTVLVDVSQNPVREAWTRSGIAKCLHTATQLFGYKRNRLLLPLELMLVQGHTASLNIPERMTSNDLHDLACMGISLPSLGVIFASLGLSVGL